MPQKTYFELRIFERDTMVQVEKLKFKDCDEMDNVLNFLINNNENNNWEFETVMYENYFETILAYYE